MASVSRKGEGERKRTRERNTFDGLSLSLDKATLLKAERIFLFSLKTREEFISLMSAVCEISFATRQLTCDFMNIKAQGRMCVGGYILWVLFLFCFLLLLQHLQNAIGIRE